MNAIVVGVLAFLVVSPAICDEGLASDKTSNEKEMVVKNPQPYYNSLVNQDQAYGDSWFDRDVRAPQSGFYGVRGKKDYDDDWFMNENEIYPQQMPKRAPYGFVGMRGRKRYDYNYRPSFIDNDDFQAELYHELQKEREMLAALMEDYNDERDKRKPVGFIGSRGKKSIDNDDYFDMDEKRSPMGFTGVRGKKSEYSNFIGMSEKRVPVASFFGMRGKKQPVVSSFFGVHKKPFFPYGKFVGVRGKKSSDSTTRQLRFATDELSNGLQPASLVAADSIQDKRIGFVGSRG